MSNATTRRLIGGLGTLLILVICGVLIGAHFIMERNIQSIDIPTYVDVTRDGAGGYNFTLNVEKLLFSEHLIDPPASELDRYPEIKALKSLSVRAVEEGGEYRIETISTSQDAHFHETLKAGGIKLVNTQWTWTKEQAAARMQQQRNDTVKLNYADYVVTKRDADGSFTAALDAMRLQRDAQIDPNANEVTDPGMRALKSLGIACAKNADGWLLQATSTSETVTDDLSAAGIQITNTQWTWTEAEMEAHLGTVETPEPTVAPTQAPQDTEAPEETPEESATPPEEHETPEPTATPEPAATATPARSANAIKSLYGFDQTDVRMAIRKAKESHYGSRLQSASVKYNYFAVGSDTSAHTNVFRVVYSVTTSSGTEYMIADVYDLESETGYTANDVHISTVNDRSDAKSTADLKGYSVYPLSGGSMVFAENKDKSPFDKNGLVMAKSITDELTTDELWDIPQTSDMTLLDLLGYARNEMFARGGHKFNDGTNYFKHFSKYSWYNPTGKVTVDDLAEMYSVTRKNITTIKTLENLIKEG